jgi:hypothetical protein
MSDEDVLRTRQSGGRQQSQYTARDLQLEMLDRLAEMQTLTETSQDMWRTELKALRQENSPLRFDPKTLVAIGAIALSITGYVLQDARNSSKRDAEIEATKVRVTHLEQIAATNTEARVRTEVQLGELREGQVEIKRLIEAHDSGVKKLRGQSSQPEQRGR